MLHFQVFTSAESPLFTIHRSFPLSDPSILHTLLTTPSPGRLSFALSSLCLSFSFPSHPTLPPTLYLALPFFRRDVSLVIARPRLPPLVDVHADSLAGEYLRVHRECSPRSPLSRGLPPVQRISSSCAVSGSLPDTTVVSPTRVFFVSPSWT